MKIGVLALQGDYAAHLRQLERCGIQDICPVTLPEHLKDLQGLIIPGGESTALLKLMEPHHFLEALSSFIHQGGSLLATCAGMILAAKKVQPTQPSLGVIDIEVIRNAYGRQKDSHIITGFLSAPYFKTSECEMVFIRAPQIKTMGPNVQILATVDQKPVMIQEGNVIALAFHPELTDDLRIHQYFLEHSARGSSRNPSSFSLV